MREAMALKSIVSRMRIAERAIRRTRKRIEAIDDKVRALLEGLECEE